MAEREQPKALVLLRIVADGLRDPIRHVKYPDEERCARCGGKWPCPNGAFDELREEIKRLVDLQRQLRQAIERAEAAERRLKYHHASYPLPKKPPQPVQLGDDYNPDLCRFCREADWEAEAQARQKESGDG